MTQQHAKRETRALERFPRLRLSIANKHQEVTLCTAKVTGLAASHSPGIQVLSCVVSLTSWAQSCNITAKELDRSKYI